MQIMIHKKILQKYIDEYLLYTECSFDGINTQDSAGDTILRYAVGFNDYESVCLLLEAGADPNIKCEANQTVLHIVASISDAEKIFEKLLEYGANINVVDDFGQYPCDIAHHSKNEQYQKYLYRND